MIKLTERERILRTYRRQEIDRVAMVDSAWSGTVKRWRKEGMLENVSWEDHFGFDRMIKINPNNSPRFERRIIEQNERYRIETTPWGVTHKVFNELDSTPENLDIWRICYDNTRTLLEYFTL